MLPPPLATCRSLGLDLVPDQMGRELGARLVADRPLRRGIDHQDQHLLGQRSSGMASLAARAASREPSQATIARRGGSTAAPAARDHQRRPAAVHERRLDQRRVVDAVRREVGLADDGEVGVQRAWRASSCGSRSSGPLARSTARSTPCRSASARAAASTASASASACARCSRSSSAGRWRPPIPGRNGSAIR